MLISSARTAIRAMIAQCRKSSTRRQVAAWKQRRLGVVEPLEPRMLLAADPIISEFMADNNGTLLDGDGNSSDWIEIYNAGDEALDLLGWTLADSSETWTFPSRELNAGELLVVFASNQPVDDYVDPQGHLHTNFALSASGEYLALSRPDTTVVSSFSPEFPAQRKDISYGLTMQTQTVELVGDAAAVGTLIPTGAVVGDWTGGDPLFDDSLWIDGNGAATGVGYADVVSGTPGLIAEWTFETSDATPVAHGQPAAGKVDETAGDAGGPYPGTATGTAVAVAGLTYLADVPAGIGSTNSLVFPAPETAANSVSIAMDSTHPIARLPLGDFRVEAWFKTTDTGRNVLAGSYAGAPTALNLELHTGNRGRIYIRGPGATTDLNVTLPNNSRDGQWHHLAGVREGSTVRLFYDGAQVGSRADVAGNYTIATPTMYLGRDSRTTSTIFNGSLDNVRFYNSADTSSPVAAYDFELSGGIQTVEWQGAAGPVDDTGGHASGPFHGAGFSASGGGTLGIHYTADVGGVLTDSTYSLALNEANPQVEAVALGMPQAVADLTLGDFTLQTWFKTTDASRAILMGSYTSGVDAMNLELHTSNRLRIYIQNAGIATTDLNVTLPSNSRDNAWHSVAAVRSGSQVKLYYDGALVGQTTDVAGSFTQSAANFYFGRDSRIDSTRFGGRLDNVRMWNIALTADQIAAMAAGATPGEVTGSVLGNLIHNDVETPMRDVNATALLRIPFNVADPTTVNSLLLKMKYDDAFVAYLNGIEVARSDNVPAGLSWDSAATSQRDIVDALRFENFNIFTPQSVLLAGPNVLAIQGLNFGAGDDEFLILPELFAISTTVDRASVRFFSFPTPGGLNDSSGVSGFVKDTTFSADRGFYDADDLAAGGALADGVVLTTETLGATIRYTIDGSWPTETHGSVYTSPIPVTTTTTLRAAAFLEGHESTNVDTHTYIFLDDVIRQPANPGPTSDPAYPLAFPLTHQPGVAADYAMDPDVLNHPLYADTIKDDLMSIPTMSIVMDMDDVFVYPTGIWANSMNDGLDSERLASVEYFDPNDPDREFQLNSAIRSQGRAARNPGSSIKHSFRLIFKDTYGLEDLPTGGPTKLNFPLFENSPVERFDTITLRGGYNYSYNHNSDSQNVRAQFMRERFMRESQLATGQLAAYGTYVHLYVNGLYFGLYAPQDRPDASFMAEHLGGDKQHYDSIGAGEVKDGSIDAWNELLRRAGQDLSVQANYDAVVRMTDVESLIDYFIVHIWGGTTDWPAPGGQQRNWYAAREQGDYDTSGNGFKFFVWDAEYSIQGTGDNRIGVNDAGSPAFVYSRMQANPEFRLLVADRLQKHFFNDGALTPDKNIARYSELADFIDRAIVGESARWGDTHPEACGLACMRDPLWVNERDWVLNTYMPGRTDTVLAQFARVGLYPQTDAPQFLIDGQPQHGGTAVAGSLLGIIQDEGTAAWFTTDGSDPREAGGAVSATATLFDGEIPLTEGILLRARVRSAGNEWSALTEATFSIGLPAAADNLVVTEINYNPAEPTAGELAIDDSWTNSAFEFIELQNVGPETIYLAGARFTAGIDYTFTEIVELDPGQYVVVAANPQALAVRYDTSGVLVAYAAYTGALASNGERIRLSDAVGNAIFDFTYNDTGAWPGRADGKGATLELIDPAAIAGDEPERTLYLEDGDHWRSSIAYGGTPGADAETHLGIVINEILSHTDWPQVDSIELQNVTEGPIDVGGWYLSDRWGWDPLVAGGGNDSYKKFRVPTGVPAETTIPPHGYLVFDERDFNPTPLNPAPNHFALDGAHGDDVWLMRADPAGNLTHFGDHVDVGAQANGESWGRWPNGSGVTYPMTMLTLGEENSGPRLGAVVISEVHYNPGTMPEANGLEFVEIYNASASAVDLTHWRLRKGVSYDFDDDDVLAPATAMVIVSFDPILETGKLIAFLTAHNPPGPIEIRGPYSGKLRDDGESVQLRYPDEPPADEPDFYPGLLADEVIYDDEGPWPIEADGTGVSLHRRSIDAWGDDATSWIVAATTPGAASFDTAVVGRHIFYNGSTFDWALSADTDGDGQFDPGEDGPNDDAAVATDKLPLLPGGVARFANYTSFNRGINGVMIDLANLPPDVTPAVGDFVFHVGNDDTSGDWPMATAPSSVTFNPGAGTGGSDRVTIIWPDDTIRDTWLEVTLKAVNLGLQEDDVFYFGNAVAEAGNSPTDARVTAADLLLARNNPRDSITRPAGITFPYDFNRDSQINATDVLLGRNNQTNFLNALSLIELTSVAEETQGLAVADLAWLSGIDKPATQRPAEKEAAEEAVDWLLAVLWS